MKSFVYVKEECQLRTYYLLLFIEFTPAPDRIQPRGWNDDLPQLSGVGGDIIGGMAPVQLLSFGAPQTIGIKYGALCFLFN
jgi:hypothetical protein